MEEFVRTNPRPTSQLTKHPAKRRPIPSEECQYLEDVHDNIVTKCLSLEGEFQQTWKDPVMKEEGLKLIKKSKNVVRDMLSELEICEKKLKGLSRPNSGSSISSNDGSESSTSPESSLSGDYYSLLFVMRMQIIMDYIVYSYRF